MDRVEMNKYKRWYDALMERAVGRNLSKPFERHHVVPVSLGGNNRHSNIVKLTCREHFLAHWLLVKFTTGVDRRKMSYALIRMVNGKIVRSSWQYALRKSLLTKVAKGNQYRKGIPNSPEAKQKISETLKGRKFTDEHKRKIGLVHKGNKHMLGKKHTPEAIEKIKVWHTGRKLSEETKAKISAAHQGMRASPEAVAKMSETQKRLHATYGPAWLGNKRG